MKSLEEHLSNKTAPKRMLALDGGGIRGALSLGYLQRVEDILRAQHGNDKNFTLSDYFDLIGGTSTGSIIAACLATGMKVADIKNMYMDLGDKIFAKKYKWWNIFQVDDLLKAGYNVAFEPVDARTRVGTSKIRLSRDGPKFFLIVLRVITIFSPLRIFLPIAAASFAGGALYAIWTIATQSHVTNSSVLLIVLSVIVFLVGLVSEQIAALRFDARR